MRFPEITHKLTGVAVPVSSLRSELSTGVGEFPDLALLGLWCQRTGLDLIQILPVNDTGTHPSPYNARSAYALNPIYLRLQDIPGSQAYAADIAAARAAFEHNERLEYEGVRQAKMQILRAIFESTRQAIAADMAFSEWVSQNSWLEPYAEFVGEADKLFTVWIQYHLDRQLRDAASKLDALNIALKGDIPILLSPDSVDVQCNPELFNKALRVGAPPDVFSSEGQNWKFPSFRWSEMEHDGFAWWRRRLQRASRFYHAYRIDHVLGFFRVWVIPEGQEGASLGFYEPAVRISAERLFAEAGLTERQFQELLHSRTLIDTGAGIAPAWYWQRSAAYRHLEDATRYRLNAIIEEYWMGQEALWRKHGTKLLSAIAKSTDMLVCGEDLGVIPECVPDVLEELGILGLRVERWAHRDGRPVLPENFPTLTVGTTSTHDSSTLRGWWEESGWNRSDYLAGLELQGECPDYLTTEVCRAIIERSLNSNSLIVMFPLQDLFALRYELRTWDPKAERINIPGTESAANWTYRMKTTIEALLSRADYNDTLQAMIARRRSLAAINKKVAVETA